MLHDAKIEESRKTGKPALGIALTGSWDEAGDKVVLRVKQWKGSVL